MSAPFRWIYRIAQEFIEKFGTIPDKAVAIFNSSRQDWDIRPLQPDDVGAAPVLHTHDVATQTQAGFLSTSDKQKLDSIEPGAQVNQHAFSAVQVGAQTISASSPTDTLQVAAGANVILSADTATKTVTIAATDQPDYGVVNVDGADLAATSQGETIHLVSGTNIDLVPDTGTKTVTVSVAPQGSGSGLDADLLDGQHASAFAAASHTHPDATASASGFMSAVDKTKLDSIEAGAEVNQNAFTRVLVGSDVIEADAKEDSLTLVAGDHIALVADTSSDSVTIGVVDGAGSGLDADTLDGQHASEFAPASHTHPVATVTTDGFMSAGDKQKLDSIEAGAQVNQNAFSGVQVGSTTITASSSSDTVTLAAGSNIVLSADPATKTVTIAATSSGGGSGGPSYAVVDVDGTDLVATSGGDTINLVSGTNVTLVPDTSTKTVTVSVSPQGAGSGLDADTVDGKHAAEFAPASHSHDPSAITPQGTGSGLDADTVDGQHASSFAPASHTHVPADVSPQGAGSGLDADLLDGQHATAFAAAGHNHDDTYVKKTGDTMSGALTIDTGSSLMSNLLFLKTSNTSLYSNAGIVLSHQAPAPSQREMLFFLENQQAGGGGKAAFILRHQRGSWPDARSVLLYNMETEELWLSGSDLRFLQSPAGAQAGTENNYQVWHSGNDGAGSGLDADLLDGQHASAFAPASHVHPDATATTAGFMSAADKTKLDSIEAGAQVNQQAFSNVKVGATTITATSETDVIELVAGSNVTLTPDASSKTITIAATGGGSSVPSYGVVNVDGTSIAAAAAGDTISFTSGAGIALTPDTATKAVTVSWQPSFYHVYNSSSQTINTATTVIASMSVTPGTYLVIASCTFVKNNTNSGSLYFYLWGDSSSKVFVNSGDLTNYGIPITLVIPYIGYFSSSISIRAQTSTSSATFSTIAQTGRIVAIRLA